MGVFLYGNFDGLGVVNFNYWVGVFNGLGCGDYSNYDGENMYIGWL